MTTPHGIGQHETQATHSVGPSGGALSVVRSRGAGRRIGVVVVLLLLRPSFYVIATHGAVVTVMETSVTIRQCGRDLGASVRVFVNL